MATMIFAPRNSILLASRTVVALVMRAGGLDGVV